MKESESRRTFLKQSAAFVAASAAAPALLTAASGPAAAAAAAAPGAPDNVLVVLQMSGGNDGINTVIPCGDPHYYDNRPNLAIPENQVLQLNKEIGLHPNCKGLKEIWDEGHLAVVQGVGYPNPDRSHFRSMDIWHTACPEQVIETGWLGKLLQQIDPHGDEPLTAINIGRALPKAFHCEGVVVPSVTALDNYGVFTSIRDGRSRQEALDIFDRIYGEPVKDQDIAYIEETGRQAVATAARLKLIAGVYQTKSDYPKSGLSADLQQAAKAHVKGGHTRIYYVQFGGFDSHAGERNTHPRLMDEMSAAITAFYNDLKAQNKSSNVLLFTFSEFGRRVKENGSGGTDHGAAGPMLVIGDAVKGGLYGEHYPSLTDLDRGDLKYAIDFRSVYATAIDRWLHLDPVKVLGKDFPRINFI